MKPVLPVMYLKIKKLLRRWIKFTNVLLNKKTGQYNTPAVVFSRQRLTLLVAPQATFTVRPLYYNIINNIIQLDNSIKDWLVPCSLPIFAYRGYAHDVSRCHAALSGKSFLSTRLQPWDSESAFVSTYFFITIK